jgi:hypothetical protein
MDGKRRFQIVNAPKQTENENAQDREQEQQGEDNQGAEEGNEQESVSLQYEPHTLQIKIEAGVNSSVQKQKDMDLLTRLMGSSETFSEFMNGYGLEILIDNLEIKNADSLKMLSAKFMQAKEEQAKAQSQQPDPVQMEMEAITNIEMAKVEQRREAQQGDMAIKAAQVAIAKQKNDIEYDRLMAEIEEYNAKTAQAEHKAVAEESKAAVDLVIEVAKLHHEQSKPME